MSDLELSNILKHRAEEDARKARFIEEFQNRLILESKAAAQHCIDFHDLLAEKYKSEIFIDVGDPGYYAFSGSKITVTTIAFMVVVRGAKMPLTWDSESHVSGREIKSSSHGDSFLVTGRSSSHRTYLATKDGFVTVRKHSGDTEPLLEQIHGNAAQFLPIFESRLALILKKP